MGCTQWIGLSFTIIGGITSLLLHFQCFFCWRVERATHEGGPKIFDDFWWGVTFKRVFVDWENVSIQFIEYLDIEFPRYQPISWLFVHCPLLLAAVLKMVRSQSDIRKTTLMMDNDRYDLMITYEKSESWANIGQNLVRKVGILGILEWVVTLSISS